MTSVIQPRSRRVEGIVPDGPVLGLTLLAIGATVLAGFALSDLERYTLLIISAICLTAFALTREYAYAIPAGITGGLGAMILATTSGSFDPASAAALPFVSLSAGFLGIWLLGLAAQPRAVHPWPLAPATVLGLIATAIAARQPGAIDWIQAGVASVLIVAGVVVVLRHNQHSTRREE